MTIVTSGSSGGCVCPWDGAVYTSIGVISKTSQQWEAGRHALAREHQRRGCIVIRVSGWVGTPANIHDDVIKWKHFSRYWPLWEESTAHRWIPLVKVSDAKLWCFLWSATEQMAEQTMETPVIWDVTRSLRRHSIDICFGGVYRTPPNKKSSIIWHLILRMHITIGNIGG